MVLTFSQGSSFLALNAISSQKTASAVGVDALAAPGAALDAATALGMMADGVSYWLLLGSI